MRESREEMLVISEAKYELYHKDFSTAMQHAYKMAKKLHGITVDPKEIDDKVASGPSKPSEGKTNSYRLEGDKGAIQIQVYNKGGSKPYELNFYKEEVELDEVGGSAFGGTIDKIQKVVDDKQATKIDGVMVDTFTASLIMKIWNGVSKQNQDKMRKMKVTQLAKAAYKLAGMKEEVDLDEKKETAQYTDGGQEKITVTVDNMRNVDIDDVVAPKPGRSRKWKKVGKKSEFDRALTGLRRNEEVELDEVSPNKPKSDVIVMKKGQVEKSVVGASAVKKAEKEGFKIQYALLKTGKKVTDPKGIMKAIKSDDKLGIGEDLEEGKMSQLHQHIKDGKSAKEIAKIMKLDVKTIQSLMDEKIVESELDENLDGRTKSYKQHRERLESLRVKRQEARDIDPADIDTSATDDDIKSADKNILMQLRKSVSLRGQHPVEFLDKKKIKIPQKIAQAALTKYSSLKKPMDKEKFQSKIAKSHRDLLMALKESNEKMGTFDEVKNLMRKFRENNNG